MINVRQIDLISPRKVVKLVNVIHLVPNPWNVTSAQVNVCVETTLKEDNVIGVRRIGTI